MRIYSLFFFIIILSCKSFKPALAKKTKFLSETEILTAYYKRYPDFKKDITMKGTLKLDIGKYIPKLGFTLSLQPGKKIELKTYFFGVPFGHALITPNLIEVYEKFQNNHLKGDFSDLKKYLNLGISLSYDQLEALIRGKSIFKLLKANYTFLFDEKTHRYIINSKHDTLTLISGEKLRGYSHRLELDENLFVKKQIIRKTVGKQNLCISYGNSRGINGESFPGQISIAPNENSASIFLMDISR